MSLSADALRSIRPYRSGDARAYHEAAMESLAEVQPWMPWCHPGFSLEDARGWVELQVQAFQERREYEFIIVDAVGELLGACGINQVDLMNRRANVGYWIRTSAARRGHASGAVRLLAGWAFENTDLERLEVVVATGNAASLRVAEKVGAVREAVLRNRLLVHGVFHPAVMFSIVRGEGRVG